MLKLHSYYKHAVIAYPPLLLLSLPLLASACVSTPVSALNTSYISHPPTLTTNASLLAPDERFIVSPSRWGPTLRSTGCLFTALSLMSTLSLLPFLGDISETIYKLDSEPGIAIAVLPTDWQTAGVMQRRFAVWGLFLAVYDMARRGDWRCNTYQLFWEGHQVGTLSFAAGVVLGSNLTFGASEALREGTLVLDNDNTTAKRSTMSSQLCAGFSGENSRNVTILSALAPVNAPTLSIAVDLLPVPLSTTDIFVTILGALSEIASSSSKDKPIADFAYREGPVPVFVSFTTLGFEQKAGKALTLRYVVETLVQLPGFMAKTLRWSEAEVEIWLDDTEVALGLLSKGVPPARRAEWRGLVAE